MVDLANLVLSCRAYAQARGFNDAPALLSYLRSHGNRALMICAWG